MSPATVAEAYECLAAVSALLRGNDDPRAAFTDVYAVITRRVRDAIQGAAESPFIEPEFISLLAGRFCALYLGALRRSLEGAPEPCRAWRIANRRGSGSPTLPIQHALLGLNAHINYDLARGLYSNVAHLGAARDAGRMARYRHDHDAVNQILEDSLPEVLALLEERYGCAGAGFVLRSGELRRALCSAALFMLRVWRTRVWRELDATLAAADERGRERVATTMNLRAGVFAAVLGVPVPLALLHAATGGRPRVPPPDLSPSAGAAGPRPGGPLFAAA